MTTVMNRTLTAQEKSLRYAITCLARVAAFAGHTWGGVWLNTPPPDGFGLSETAIEEWVVARSEEGPCGWGITSPSIEWWGGTARLSLYIGRGVTVRADVDWRGDVTFEVALTSRGNVGRGKIRHDQSSEDGWVYTPSPEGLLRAKDVARFIVLVSKLYDFDTDDEEVITSFESVFGGMAADRGYLTAPNAGHLLAGETDPAAIIAEAKAEAAAGNFYAARAALLGLDDEEFVRVFLEG